MYVVVHAWLGKGNGLRMPTDVQASLHDSTVHVWRFFLPKWRSRQLWYHFMTSLLSCLHKWRKGIKESMHKPIGSFFFWFWFWLVGLVNFSLGSHRSSEVFFICSSICVEGYPVHPELVCFSCLWVSQVTCHPASIQPGIGEARTTALWSGVVHAG